MAAEPRVAGEEEPRVCRGCCDVKEGGPGADFCLL